ncbi:terminase gpP N-terminus-related DNA-binding protein, partial [Bacillus sp. HC-Mk]
MKERVLSRVNYHQTIYFYVQGFSIKDITNMIGRSEKT